MNGSYIGSVTTSYLKGDIVTYKCNFGPDNYTGSIECGEKGWKDEPSCPAKDSGCLLRLPNFYLFRKN